MNVKFEYASANLAACNVMILHYSLILTVKEKDFNQTNSIPDQPLHTIRL